MVICWTAASGPVGVILLISSKRGEQIILQPVELVCRAAMARAIPSCCFAGDPSSSSRLSQCLARAPHAWRTLHGPEALALTFFGRQRRLRPARPWHGARGDPDDLPEAGLLRDHRDMGGEA